MKKAALVNTLSQAITNTDATKESVTLSPPLLDDLQKRGLFFTLHDAFLTVSFEGDSETFEATDSDKAASEAVEAAISMLEAYDEEL